MIKEEFILQSKTGKDFLCDVRYNKTDKQKPVILFVHGFKGFKDWAHFNLIADYFANHGFVYVKINLSHNGTTIKDPFNFVDLEAFGNNNFSIELDDLGVLIDYIFSEKSIIPALEIELEKLFLIGHSRGGSLVLLKTAEDSRITKTVTFAAMSDLDNRWPKDFIDEWKQKGVQYIYNGRTKQDMPLYYQLVKNYNENKERLDVPENTKRISIPLLITHGTNDETLPLSMAKELVSWNKNAELFIIDDANHVFGATHPFLNKKLPTHTQILLEKTLNFLI